MILGICDHLIPLVDIGPAIPEVSLPVRPPASNWSHTLRPTNAAIPFEHTKAIIHSQVTPQEHRLCILEARLRAGTTSGYAPPQDDAPGHHLADIHASLSSILIACLPRPPAARPSPVHVPPAHHWYFARRRLLNLRQCLRSHPYGAHCPATKQLLVDRLRKAWRKARVKTPV